MREELDNKELLEDLYFNKNMPIKMIAKHLNTTKDSVAKAFNAHGIERRDPSTWKRGGCSHVVLQVKKTSPLYEFEQNLRN